MMIKYFTKNVNTSTTKMKDNVYFLEPPVHHEMKMGHPTVLLASPQGACPASLVVLEPQVRSKSVRLQR